MSNQSTGKLLFLRLGKTKFLQDFVTDLNISIFFTNFSILQFLIFIYLFI